MFKLKSAKAAELRKTELARRPIQYHQFVVQDANRRDCLYIIIQLRFFANFANSRWQVDVKNI